MTRQRLLTTAGILLAVCLLLPLLTVQMIPDRVVEQLLVRTLADQGIRLQARHLGTALPIGIKGAGITLGDETATLLAIDRVSLRLRLLPLLTGTVSAHLEGAIGTGTVSGDIAIFPRTRGTLQATGLELDSLPVVTRAIEGTMKGTLTLDAEFRRTGGALGGDAKLRITGFALSKAKLAAMPLPDLSVPDTRGMLKLNGASLGITNLAMQGDGIYVRLGGSLPLNPVSPLSLTLELQPSAELLERQKSVFLLMFPYLTSPGRYSLPIGGTLASPQLSTSGGSPAAPAAPPAPVSPAPP